LLLLSAAAWQGDEMQTETRNVTVVQLLSTADSMPTKEVLKPKRSILTGSKLS